MRLRGILPFVAAVVLLSSPARAQVPAAPVSPAPGATPLRPARPLVPAAGAPKVQRPVTFVVDMGYDWGSTELLEIELTDGSDQTLSANQGFWMQAGAAFLRKPVGKVTFDTVATFGFKYSSVGADDGSFRYLAFPLLEVMERAAVGPVRFAFGASYAVDPSLKGDGVLSDLRVDLKPSLGLVFRLDVIGNRHGQSGMFGGLRYVWQKLEGENGSAPIDANAFGVAFGFDL